MLKLFFFNYDNQKKKINASEENIIVDLWQKGRKLRETGEIVDRLHTSVQTVVKKFEYHLSFGTKAKMRTFTHIND